MTTREEVESWAGRSVRGRDGASLGRLRHVYLARADDHPTWGLVGGRLRRGRLVPLADAQAGADNAIIVSVDRDHVRAAPQIDAGEDLDPATEARLEHHYARRGALTETRARQHDAYGGLAFGAALFGWITATGTVIVLAAILGAVAAAVGATLDVAPGQQAASPVGLTGAIAAIVVFVLAYFAGGYVAGRMARFDGARNGFAAWLIGIVVTVIAVALTWTAGAQFDVLQRLSLPAVPIDARVLTVAGLITLAAVLLGTLLAAILGGKLGERFHRKIDKAGFDA